MSVLTLDLGSTTGFTLKCRGGAVTHGFWSLKGGRSEGAGMRYLRFRSCLNNLHTSSHIRYVAFEDVRRHNGTDAAHVFGGLRAVLMAWCEENGIPYEGVSVQAIKKHVTGKGNAGKREVVAAVKRHGFEGVVDENEADAVALMILKLEDPVVRVILAI